MKYTSIIDNTNRPFAIDFGKKNVTANAGLPFLMDRMRRAGFDTSLAEIISRYAPRPRPFYVYDTTEILNQMLGAYFLGRPDFIEVEDLSRDELFRRCMLNRSVASAATLSRFCDRIEQVCRDQQTATLLERDIKFEDLEKTNAARVTNPLFDELLDATLDQAIRLLKKQGHNGWIHVDVDSTPIELFGLQDEGSFDAHYGVHSYLPIFVSINGIPAFVQNAPGAASGAKLMLLHVRHVVTKLKSAFPNAKIVIRGDTGYNNDDLIEAIKAEGCRFLFGCNVSAKKMRLALADEVTTFFAADLYGTLKVPPEVFNRLVPLGGLFEDRLHGPGKRTKTTAYTQDGKFRTCGFLRDFKLKSWSSSRTIAYRLQYSPGFQDIDLRFIQTNLSFQEIEELAGKRGVLKHRALPTQTFEPTSESAKAAIGLYEAVFSDRGQAERLNSEWKSYCLAERCSLKGFFSNSFRLVLALTVMQVFEELRIEMRRREEPRRPETKRGSRKPNRTRAHWAPMRRCGPTIRSIRRNLICVPCEVSVTKTRVTIRSNVSQAWQKRFDILLS